jgi:hypothetical protein
MCSSWALARPRERAWRNPQAWTPWESVLSAPGLDMYRAANLAIACRCRAARRASCSARARRVRLRALTRARVQSARVGQSVALLNADRLRPDAMAELTMNCTRGVRCLDLLRTRTNWHRPRAYFRSKKSDLILKYFSIASIAELQHVILVGVSLPSVS